MRNVEGKIAAILSPVKVVINKGSDDGVEQGDYFVIYSELGPFPDPDTKQDLGSTRQSWGRVKVSIVEKRFCVAETEVQFRNPFLDVARVLGGSMQQQELPVDETQIWTSIEKIEIGFPARLVKPARQPEEQKKTEELPPAQPSLLGPANYRRKKDNDTWHFCSNCSNWPTTDFLTEQAKPTGEFCDECKSKLVANTCQ